MVSQESLTQLIFDRKRFIETFMTLENKERERVPFILNHIQDRELAEQSEFRRDIYVKPAQVGSTTLWAAIFLHDTMTRKGTTSVIVAHEEFITQRLLNKVQSLYDNLPPAVRVPMHRSSSYEKTFPDVNGIFYIGSARSYVFGRGEPIHNFLGSEVAFWPDATKIMVPTGQRVPLHGTIVLESTPNGEDGNGKYFRDTYVQGKDGRGIYHSHFYRWWDHEEYQLEEGNMYALPMDRGPLFGLVDEELVLMETHGVTEPQIRWRRRKIKEFEQMQETGETRLMFGQEFPEDDVRCFIAVGDAAYDGLTVEKMARACYLPKDSYQGALVWRTPEEGHNQYVVSVDPGMGKDSKTVLQVWEFGDDEGIEWGTHCATDAGYYTAEVTAGKARSLADYYHGALIAVETNPPGVPVAYLLQNYRNLYMRQDIISGKRTRMIGWLTTPRTKPYMIQEFTRILPRITTYDINLVSQMRNMRFVGDRVMPVGPDDYHDAAAIAIVCRPSVRKGGSGLVGVAGGWDEKWGI